MCRRSVSVQGAPGSCQEKSKRVTASSVITSSTFPPPPTDGSKKGFCEVMANFFSLPLPLPLPFLLETKGGAPVQACTCICLRVHLPVSGENGKDMPSSVSRGRCSIYWDSLFQQRNKPWFLKGCCVLLFLPGIKRIPFRGRVLCMESIPPSPQVDGFPTSCFCLFRGGNGREIGFLHLICLFCAGMAQGNRTMCQVPPVLKAPRQSPCACYSSFLNSKRKK